MGLLPGDYIQYGGGGLWHNDKNQTITALPPLTDYCQWKWDPSLPPPVIVNGGWTKVNCFCVSPHVPDPPNIPGETLAPGTLLYKKCH